MTKVFGDSYSYFYDQVYKDKNYKKEAAALSEIFRKSGRNVDTILDLGCGTGNYSFPLVKNGFQVTGVDISADMLNKAKEKRSNPSAPDFILGDVRNVRLNRKFDAIIMMFAVLGYQIENKDIVSSLTTARIHLDKGSLFLFDVWYGPGVLYNKPSERIKLISPAKDEKIIRIASGNLDINKNICTVKYDFLFIRKKKLVDEIREEHKMRYFFPKEIEFFLENTGFELIRIGRFPQIEEAPDVTDWNFFIEAKAV